MTSATSNCIIQRLHTLNLGYSQGSRKKKNISVCQLLIFIFNLPSDFFSGGATFNSTLLLLFKLKEKRFIVAVGFYLLTFRNEKQLLTFFFCLICPQSCCKKLQYSSLHCRRKSAIQPSGALALQGTSVTMTLCNTKAIPPGWKKCPGDNNRVPS